MKNFRWLRNGASILMLLLVNRYGQAPGQSPGQSPGHKQSPSFPSNIPVYSPVSSSLNYPLNSPVSSSSVQKKQDSDLETAKLKKREFLELSAKSNYQIGNANEKWKWSISNNTSLIHSARFEQMGSDQQISLAKYDFTQPLFGTHQFGPPNFTTVKYTDSTVCRNNLNDMDFAHNITNPGDELFDLLANDPKKLEFVTSFNAFLPGGLRFFPAHPVVGPRFPFNAGFPAFGRPFFAGNAFFGNPFFGGFGNPFFGGFGGFGNPFLGGFGGFGNPFIGGFGGFGNPFFGGFGGVNNINIVVNPVQRPLVIQPTPPVAQPPIQIVMNAPGNVIIQPGIPINPGEFIIIQPKPPNQANQPNLPKLNNPIPELPKLPEGNLPKFPIVPKQPNDLKMPKIEKAPEVKIEIPKKKLEVKKEGPGGNLLSEVAQANPIEESKRLQQLGLDAFEEHQFGKALERLKQAVRIAPDQGDNYFLLAEAQFACEKYREAVATINKGLKVQKNWPKTRFSPRQLYGVQQFVFEDQLMALEKLVKESPKDSILEFLYAYHLWFEGKQKEAKVHFEKLISQNKDDENVLYFLK